VTPPDAGGRAVTSPAGRAIQLSDARFVLRQIGTALVFYAWSRLLATRRHPPSRALDRSDGDRGSR
jgi:hypothetical protein